MNTSNIIQSNLIQDNDWGLFIDVDTNNVSIHPDVTIKPLEKSKVDTIPYRKNSSNIEFCFQYLYYYWGVYIIQYVHK